MAQRELQQLEHKMDELIALCDQLNSENRQLKADADRWQREREQLLEKNELARERVEAMIQRLRALEQES